MDGLHAIGETLTSYSMPNFRGSGSSSRGSSRSKTSRGRSRNRKPETQDTGVDRLDRRRANRLIRSGAIGLGIRYESVGVSDEKLVVDVEERHDGDGEVFELAGDDCVVGEKEKGSECGCEKGKRKRSSKFSDETAGRAERAKILRSGSEEWRNTVLIEGGLEVVEDGGLHLQASERTDSNQCTLEVDLSVAAKELTGTPSLQDIENQEREFLHSDNFPIIDLQPAKNFLDVMSAVVPIIGDSGTGWARFGPESPVKPAFLSPTNQYLPSSSVETQRYQPRSFLYAPNPQQSGRHSSGGKRKFSQAVSPLLRTGHLEIDLLQRKISHGELLSLRLSNEARRLAIEIGGAPGK